MRTITRPRAFQPGMTIMEMIVVTAVVALVMTGVALGIGSLTRQKLGSSSVRVAALVRTAYSRAATTGKTVRIVFDIDSDLMWVEEADGGRVLLSRDGEEEEGEEEGEEGEELAAGPSDIGAKAMADNLATALGDDPDQLLGAARASAETDLGGNLDFGMMGALGSSGPDLTKAMPTPRYKAPRFTAPEGRLGKRIRLESGVTLSRVETAHREGPAEEGRAYLYFFPGGVTELAVIQLQDTGGYVNSVEVHPLTGRCNIHDVPYELPTREEDLNEAREGF